MKIPTELCCLVCQRVFCCADCRRTHERTVHSLQYECPICRCQKFLCSAENISNQDLLSHIVQDHLPLQCCKCSKMFNSLSDLTNSNSCIQIIMNRNQNEDEENEVITNIINEEKESEDRFNSIYERITPDLETVDKNFEDIVACNEKNKTATIISIVQEQRENIISEEDIKRRQLRTPHPCNARETRLKRTDTPHMSRKKLVLQLATDGSNGYNVQERGTLEPTQEDAEGDTPESAELCSEITPSGVIEHVELQEGIHTPVTRTLKVDACATAASAVTTSTPTHPANSQWGMFPEPGTDSPLSEIEGSGEAASPAESLNESPKDGTASQPSESDCVKLKSIMVTNSRSRLESQDSSEKQVTFAESVSEELSSLNKNKKVKFAHDTKFEENKLRRVFCRPKRVVTPGPIQRSKKISNPHFQALLNRFESNRNSVTPVIRRGSDQEDEYTPVFTDVAPIPARAINFKDESPLNDNPIVSLDTPGSEMYKTCLGSPEARETKSETNQVIETFGNNIAGSIKSCLSMALETNDNLTEVQFKFSVIKKRSSIRRVVEEVRCEVKHKNEKEGETEKSQTMWSSLAKAVKSVLWSRTDEKENCASSTSTPFSNVKSSLDLYSSATKRKLSEVSDVEVDPINHKRYKEARIRGRRPLPRMLRSNASTQTSTSLEDSDKKESSEEELNELSH